MVMGATVGLLATALAAALSGPIPLAGAQLDCRLTAEKTTVMVAEPVWLRLSCRNAGEKPVDLNFATRGVLAWRTSPQLGPSPCHDDRPVDDHQVEVPPWHVAIPAGGTKTFRLLLNRWLRIQQPGVVRVALVSCTEDAYPLVRSGNLTVWSSPKPQERFLSNEVGLELVPTDEARLGAICEVLTQQAIAARHTDDGLQAAEALSWIDLPLAEPSLERLLPLDSLGAALAANGLARIGNPEAVRALILAFDQQSNPWTRMAIKAWLQALNPALKDPELRKRLELILRHEAVVLAEPN
jgi:hypothetical protein